jgi:hypothetical protein
VVLPMIVGRSGAESGGGGREVESESGGGGAEGSFLRNSNLEYVLYVLGLPY